MMAEWRCERFAELDRQIALEPPDERHLGLPKGTKLRSHAEVMEERRLKMLARMQRLNARYGGSA